MRSAVDWLAQQLWVDPRRMVLMEQSHGGLTALAYATGAREGVLGVVNFAGGPGGAAKLVAYGPFKDDAHGTFGDRQGLVVWWPETEAFLAALGLPVAQQPRGTPEDPALAALEDLSKLPSLSPGCAGV